LAADQPEQHRTEKMIRKRQQLGFAERIWLGCFLVINSVVSWYSDKIPRPIVTASAVAVVGLFVAAIVTIVRKRLRMRHSKRSDKSHAG
jgi:hypothetical protein